MDSATVLIIEDDASIAQFVAASLSAGGLRPVTATTAAQGLQEARDRQPKLVIVDLGLPDLALYQTCKAAIEGLTRSLARDFGRDNIRVTSVIPGNVRTPRQLQWYTPEGEAEIVAAQCMDGRLLPPDTTSVVPLRLFALYAASPRRLAEQLGLVEADAATANVVLAAPQDERILPGPGEPVALAPTALVVADLLTLPGRSDAEAEQLMDALAAKDPSWKE